MELWFSEEQATNIRFSFKVKEQIYSKQSDFQKIDIFDTDVLGRVFTLDGVIMTTEKDEFIYHEMISHVPLNVNPNIEKVLIIGGGDGGTVRELTKHKNIKKIDMVEIDEEVVIAAKKYLTFTSEKLDDPRVKLYFQDGIQFVKESKEIYDLIIVDSTDPIGPGEGLFSTEFYNDCYSILSDDGILVNQSESPYYLKDARELVRATSKLKNIFPIAKVYQYHLPTYGSGHWLFGFASKKYDPIRDFKNIKYDFTTKYYNLDIHLAAFALPTYVQKMIDESKIVWDNYKLNI
ncbi:MAG: polyamine aminopropyltransferase [Fusobacteria bacterium]|nr:polyamine aminopropyltransferase [Fusobacteriota bacterium]